MKVPNNKPKKVRCPVCAKFMEEGIPRGSHCIEFRHHCTDPGSFVKLSFYSEYRYGRYGRAKSVHWRPAKNFKIVRFRKPEPKPVTFSATPDFTSDLEKAVRDVFEHKVAGVNIAIPTLCSFSLNHNPYSGLTVDMNILVTIVN